MSEQPASEARALLTAEATGVLSTISVDVRGYPFGSVVPYCLDRHGRPVILISRIAQHHKNVTADPRASLIVLERGTDDVQVNGRLTCVADVVKLPAAGIDAIAGRYYRYFPQSSDFHRIHDFEFFRLEPLRFRYIGGFGRIHWVEPAKLMLANPFTEEDEQSMVAHMNADHVDAMRHYCQLAGVGLTDKDTPALAGVDAEGFHILVGARLVRFLFEHTVSTGADVRRELVALARRGHAP